MALGPPIPEFIRQEGIFIQQLTPIGGSLIGSFFVGIIPLLVVLVMLGVFRLPAYYSALSGLIVCIFIAIFGWQMPALLAFEAIGNGIVYANWPIMWIVFNAMFIYNITVHSGIFHLFRRWMISSTPPDLRVILLIIGFCFGALLEGVAGFGVPGAICSSMMVSLGFKPEDALVFTLIFDTTPVAFGALGIPVTTLASLTGLPVLSLSAMMGRQLPFVSVFLPIYALLFYAGPRAGLIECWPIAVVAGISFALVQSVFANFVGPELPDLMAGLASLIAVVSFVQYWKPPYRAEYEANLDFILSSEISLSINKNCLSPKGEEQGRKTLPNTELKLTWKQIALAWCPWLTIVLVVIVWSFAQVSRIGQIYVEWPYLHQQVWLTLYGKKYDAVWVFQPLATGTAILVASIPFSVIVVLVYGLNSQIFSLALRDTIVQLYKPILTVSLIMAFAYLFNYSGIVYTIGYQLASVGRAFPFLSAWLGWVACFLSGSDTSANTLFGNLQVVAAREIGLSAVLMASTNSSGAVTSKMISPQNLTTGVSTIGLQGQEGRILRRTILHSIFMCCIMGTIACIQQYAVPGMIPSES
ncbi:lactate permease [Gilbertella persicaria]|uniref:lactate permease n=1 Tax=Gilbertella persicaria TaxID=101096 RepID=UPI00221F00BF|nr:lactate permease [Gilbertella persicaria]KAI8088032.1 lactate permease [Gilbertella persicaria]